MRTFLGLLVCFGLATLGSSLECKVCTLVGASDDTDCSGSTVLCEADKDACTFTVVENSIGGFLMTAIEKNCGSLDTCRHGPKYMNLGEGKIFRSNITCCVEDACQMAIPQVPLANTETNGMQCPACYALATGCREEIVDCLGSEDHCLDMAIRVTYGDVVMNTVQKGCVSKSVCDDLKKGETNFIGGSATLLNSECKPADIKAQTGAGSETS